MTERIVIRVADVMELVVDGQTFLGKPGFGRYLKRGPVEY